MRPSTSRGGVRGTVDDVAENIRNEQRAGAAPSSEEIESQRRRTEEFHAELKAVQALIEALNLRDHVDVAFAIAEHCEFETFDRHRSRGISQWHRGPRRWKELKQGHDEPHEHPGPASDFERQAPPAAHRPPFEVTDRVRKLKADAWAALPDPDETTVETECVSAGGAVRYRVTISSPAGTTTTQLVDPQ